MTLLMKIRCGSVSESVIFVSFPLGAFMTGFLVSDTKALPDDKKSFKMESILLTENNITK